MEFSTHFNVGDTAYLVNLPTKKIERCRIQIVQTAHDQVDSTVEYLVGGIWVNENPNDLFALFASRKRAVAFLEEKHGSLLEIAKQQLSDRINFYKQQLERAELDLEKLLTNK